MDDGRVNLVEVLERVDDLHDNRAAFLLTHQLILLQIEVQIVAFTILQYCAEPAGGTRQKNRDSPGRPEKALSSSISLTSLCRVRSSRRV